SAGAFPGQPVGLYARGPNATLIATYVLARDASTGTGPSRMKWYVLRDGFLTYRALFERPRALHDSFRLMPADGHRTTSFDREIPAAFFVFDVLRTWDLPELLASTPAQGLMVNFIDGDGHRLPAREAQERLPRQVRVISAAEPDPAVRGLLRNLLERR